MVKRTSNPTSHPSASGSESSAGRGKSAAGLLDNHLANLVKDSAQHIWLAGMGAFSKAQEGRNKVFETLVKEGLGLQKKTQGLAEDKINEMTGRMNAVADTVTTKAGQNWDKLESIFEQRTAKAMNRLGVPTAKDVDALVKRVDELAAAVASLSKAVAVRGEVRGEVRSAVRGTAAAAKSAGKAVGKTAKATLKLPQKVAAKPTLKRTRKSASV